jgi:hypothetical protein
MDKLGWIIALVYGVAWLIKHFGLGKFVSGAPPMGAEEADSLPGPKLPKPASSRGKPRVAPSPGAPSAARRALEAFEKARLNGLARLGGLSERAAKLAEAAQRDRAIRRFADALTGFVPREIARARAEVQAGKGAAEATGAIELVLDEIELLMEQRKNPELLPELGDADAFADACYAPVIAFARAEGLPLTSGFPATQLADIDLAIWTGFIPTSVAPIFLSSDFFSSARRWPAIAHEIGHDFLASIDGLEPSLRRQLNLPGVRIGARPLTLETDGIQSSELTRVFGAWFEEIFCDVFGTLMCGPAYVTTMSACFAAKDDPQEVLVVSTDATGISYDTHPPPHLRVLVGCMVLDRAGFHAEAIELRKRWEARHAGAALDYLLFPVAGSWLALPSAPFMSIAGGLLERLYVGPLDALSGFGLQDVSGIDYGPHEHQEALRARDALLSGLVPKVRDARAVIAGAVLATERQPDREPQILMRARAAIQAVGTSERRIDAYTLAQGKEGSVVGAGQVDRGTAMEALVLREILLPPRALRGRRRARL